MTSDWKGESLKDLEDVPESWNPKDRKTEAVEMDIWDVTLNPTNPFVHDQKQLKLVRKSYEHYGALEPVIIDQNNIIVAGHCRIMSMRQRPPKTTKIQMLRVWFESDLERDMAAAMLNTSQWPSKAAAVPLNNLADRIIEAGGEPLMIGLERTDVDDMVVKSYEGSPEVMADTTGLVGIDSDAGMNNIEQIKLFFDKDGSKEEYIWFLNHYELSSRVSKVALTRDFIRQMMENERRAQAAEENNTEETDTTETPA